MEARQAHKAVEERANASVGALAEVRTVLNFPFDTVNRCLLFTTQLEKEDKLNRGHIIRFYLDHSQKMEKTWENMVELVANMTPEGPETRGTQAPKELATLV